jgi:hypothetical protein
MARPTDPTFGADFDGDTFRNAIFSTMEMGMPNRPNEKLTFLFEGKATYPVTDQSGTPYDLHAAPTSVPGEETRRVLAVGSVEYIDRASDGTRLGDFDNPRAVVTLLDKEYLKVEGATSVLLGGDLYEIKYVTVGALFDVDVFEVQCQAEAEGA